VILEMHIVHLLRAPHLCFPCYMDPDTVNMMPGTSVAAHISLLHNGMIAYVQDPFSEFCSITVRAH